MCISRVCNELYIFSSNVHVVCICIYIFSSVLHVPCEYKHSLQSHAGGNNLSYTLSALYIQCLYFDSEKYAVVIILLIPTESITLPCI